MYVGSSKSLPEVGDTSVEVIFLDVGLRPDPLQEFSLTNQSSGMADENDQGVENFGSKVDDFVAAIQSALIDVESIRTKFKY